LALNHLDNKRSEKDLNAKSRVFKDYQIKLIMDQNTVNGLTLIASAVALTALFTQLEGMWKIILPICVGILAILGLIELDIFNSKSKRRKKGKNKKRKKRIPTANKIRFWIGDYYGESSDIFVRYKVRGKVKTRILKKEPNQKLIELTPITSTATVKLTEENIFHGIKGSQSSFYNYLFKLNKNKRPFKIIEASRYGNYKVLTKRKRGNR
jgi:hypothetical protein